MYIVSRSGILHCKGIIIGIQYRASILYKSSIPSRGFFI
ncbi:hypothetical protein [Staphylococcus phage PT1-4]